jgi:chromosome segregation ATPase
VRAGNLQDLVYKQGQAGVTKASVTIVFNNSDTENSPISYESSKQITVTRQVNLLHKRLTKSGESDANAQPRNYYEMPSSRS